METDLEENAVENQDAEFSRSEVKYIRKVVLDHGTLGRRTDEQHCIAAGLLIDSPTVLTRLSTECM